MSTTAADRDAPGGYDHDPAPRPGPGPAWYARKLLKALASLQLTVVLFALAIGLVFFGTLAQIEYGIWTVVDRYFWSWYVAVPFDLFNQFGKVFFDFPKGGPPWPGAFPFPAGKLLGGLMLANLLAAHLTRFRVSWKRSGILLIHSGLILLFVGEFVTREYAVEQRMIIPEGQTVGFTQDARACELALVDHSGADDVVAVVPESLLKAAKGRITDPGLPVDIEVVEFMPNSALADADPAKPNRATAGVGRSVVAAPRREVSGTDTDQKVDVQAAYVTLYRKGTDQALGTYLAQAELNPQAVEVDGTRYDLGLRFRRYYKPYTIKLEKFRHDVYMGTDKAKNFSSQVVLTDDAGAERDVLIRMNSPLRHAGETFYQGSYIGTTTVLQVVKNPGWLIPYISCAVVTLGLVVHFGVGLAQFLTRRAA